jgi:hypothetical protein
MDDENGNSAPTTAIDLSGGIEMDFSYTAVPEPIGLAIVGLGGICFLRRPRRLQ